MGFAAEFDAWLTHLLRDYISVHVAQIARVMEPTIVTLATLYLMVFGFLALTGRVEAPLTETLKRVAVIVGVLVVGVKLALYQPLIVDTFYSEPAKLAASIVDAHEPVTIVDDVIFAGGDVGAALMKKAGLFDGNFAYYLVACLVYAVTGFVAIYTLFLLLLSRVALAVLLTLGPIFLGCLFFRSTTRLCESWLAQLTNYALVSVLAAILASLMLHVLTVDATRAMARGTQIEIADAVRVCLAAGLTLLVLRQVPQMAGALASGVAIVGYSMLSRAVLWGSAGAAYKSTQFGRGFLMDQGSTRWDSLPRRLGEWTGRHTWRAALGRPRRNTVQPVADSPVAWGGTR